MNEARFRASLFAGLLAGIVGLTVYFFLSGYDFEEDFAFKSLSNFRGKRPPPREVAIIAIDRKSIRELGLPERVTDWSRSIHANLIRRLAREGASVVVFDVHFKEARGDDGDRDLAAALREAKNVVLISHLNRERELLSPALLSSIETSTPPASIFAAEARGIADFVLPRNPGGTHFFWSFRASRDRTPTIPTIALQLYANDHLESMLEAWKRALGTEAPPDLSDVGTSTDAAIPVQRIRKLFLSHPAQAAIVTQALRTVASRRDNGRDPSIVEALLHMYQAPDIHYLNFYGPPRTIETIPLARAVDASDPAPLDVRGKAVFVGLSDESQMGEREGFFTPFSEDHGANISGVEIAATAFANLLHRESLHILPLAGFFLLILGYGVGISLPLGLFPLRIALPLSLIETIAYTATAEHFFAKAHLLLPLFVPLLVITPSALFSVLLIRYREANVRRRASERLLTFYLPPHAVEQLRLSPGPSSLPHEVRYGVCLAVDANDFTGFGETLPPTELARVMNDYYRQLFGPIQTHGGIVSDVIGDAMLALWISNDQNSEICRSACQAALDIIAIPDRERGLSVRIGVHAGAISLGHVGALNHYEYRAVGDIVNTTSRLEKFAKETGAPIVISDEIASQLQGFIMEPLGSHVLAGKKSPLVLWRLVGVQSVPFIASS